MSLSNANTDVQLRCISGYGNLDRKRDRARTLQRALKQTFNYPTQTQPSLNSPTNIAGALSERNAMDRRQCGGVARAAWEATSTFATMLDTACHR